MSLPPNLLRTAAIVGLWLVAPAPVAAQAFTPPEATGSVTLSWQFVENTGHRFSDGSFLARGQSQTTSVLFEVEYGLTDRLAVTAGIPYVFARYTGANAPLSGLPRDLCRCWQSSFQDVALSARYRFGTRLWAVTPVVRYSQPSHHYEFAGEAVVGRNLRELQLGLSAGRRLGGFLSRAAVQTSYVHAFVQTPIPSISIDRGNGFLDFGYALSSRLYVRGNANFQRTYGGLRAGSPTGTPFFFPGELTTPERLAQRDRLLRSHYWQAGAGASYSLGPVDVFGSISKYVWGRDAHNGQVYNIGISWYFER